MEIIGLGLFYEDLTLGRKFRTVGRTITEPDIVNFVNATGFTEVLFTDLEFLRTPPLTAAWTRLPLCDQLAVVRSLGARLDAGPAALHRVPESVLHIVEALWLQCVEEARKRAAAELETKAVQADNTEQKLEVRSYVLTLREGELDRRLRERDAAATSLEAQLAGLATLLRKEQAARQLDQARITTLERELTDAREDLARSAIVTPASEPAARSRKMRRQQRLGKRGPNRAPPTAARRSARSAEKPRRPHPSRKSAAPTGRRPARRRSARTTRPPVR